MAVFDNLNLTTSPGLDPTVVEYHNRGLLENMRPELVHYYDVEKVTLPRHNGKRIQFRRLRPFGPVTEPLKEGVTPDGQALVFDDLWATIKPYGRHVELSDEIDWAMLDNMHEAANENLSNQAADTVDVICREALNAGVNVQYAGGKSMRSQIAATDILTFDEIKKAVLRLQKANVKPFSDGFYHAIVGPDTEFDVTTDDHWTDIAEYQQAGNIQKYEIGTIWGVKFYRSTEAKVFRPQEYLYVASQDKVSRESLTVTGWDAQTRKLTISETDFSYHQARMITGMLVNLVVGTNTYTVNIEHAEPYVDAEHPGKLQLRWVPASLASDVSGEIVPTGGGAGNIPVMSTLVYGKGFAGSVELEGDGRNVAMIIKPLGSAGAADPLNQRQTMGWKIRSFCCVILQDTFGVRIEHAASQAQ